MAQLFTLQLICFIAGTFCSVGVIQNLSEYGLKRMGLSGYMFLVATFALFTIAMIF